MSTVKRVVKNTGFLYAKMAITVFISLYTTRLVLAALGSEDFGVFNLVGGIIAMLGFFNASMASATQRFMSYAEGEGDKEKQKKVFNVSFVLHFIIALLLGFILWIVGYFLFDGVLNIDVDKVFAAKVIFFSLILSTMFTVMTVPYDAVLNANENMLYYSIVGIVESILKLIVAIVIFYMLGDKLIWYGVLMAIVPIVIMLIMRVYCHRKYAECVLAPREYMDKRLMREMSGFAGWGLLTSATTMITMQGAAIVLNVFFGVLANAAHSIANQIGGQIMVFSNNMLKALNPNIVKSAGAKDTAGMIRMTTTGSKFSFMLLAVLAVPVCLEMPYFLKIWLKDVPEYAILFCRLVIIRLVITQFHVPLSSAILAGGRVKIHSLLISFIALLTLPFTIGLYHLEFPIYTIYIVFIGMTLLYLVVNLFFIKKRYQLNIMHFLRHIVFRGTLCAFFSFLGGVLIIEFMPSTFYRFLVVTIICMIIFLALFYFLVLENSEKNIIRKLISKR